MPRCSSPCASIPAPSPTARSRSTLELSRMPALMRAATYSLVRASTTIDSMPSCARMWASSRPAGPAPMMATSVRMGLFIEDKRPMPRRRAPRLWPRSPPRRGPPPLTHGLIPNDVVGPLVEVRDEAGPGGPPAEPLPGDRAGRRKVDRGESRERAELVAGILGSDRLGRHPQVAPDDLGDLPKRHPLVGDRVQQCPGRRLL